MTLYADKPLAILIYPTNTASDIPNYMNLVDSMEDENYNVEPCNCESPAISGTDQEFAKFISKPGVFIGNPGVINLTITGGIKRISGMSTATFYFKMFRREENGTEHLVATSFHTNPVDQEEYQEFTADAVLDNGMFKPEDRIVIKWYGTKGHTGGNSVFQFHVGGTNPTKIRFPFNRRVYFKVN